MDIKNKKQMGIISLIVLVVLLGLFISVKALIGDYSKKTNGPIYSTAQVVKGDISVGVKAKGQLQPSGDGRIEFTRSNYYYEMPNFTIKEILVKEGDSVTEGQLLMKMVSSNLDSSLKTKQEELNTLLDELSEKTGKPKSEVEYINPAKGIVLVAPIDGRVSSPNVEVGDELEVGHIISTIIDDSKFKIKAKLTTEDVAKVKEGDTVKLKFPYFEGTIDGTITSINSTPIPDTSGDKNIAKGYIYPTYIEATNPGLVQKDMDVQVGLATSDGQGVSFFKYNGTVEGFMEEEKMINKVKCLVTDVHVYDYQEVKKGDPIISLSGEDMQDSIRKTLDQVKMLRRNIEQLKEQYNNLEIKSSMNGIVSSIEKKVGAQVNMWESLGYIYNTDKMMLWVRVDDIDIINVRQGAPVSITVDAVPGETFEGKVSHVSSRGNESGGVTKFDVNIDVTGGPGLRPGMQATGYIDAGEAKDVLLVPIEAVFEENGEEMVEVLEDGVPKIVKVATGLMNDRFAEITEGLEEGQLVITGSSKDLLPSEHIQADNFMPSNESSNNDESVNSN